MVQTSLHGRDNRLNVQYYQDALAKDRMILEESVRFPRGMKCLNTREM